ncbi:ISL3 family transposase [Glutamicibacter protophormiae]|uniref:ISL3 family transposase n=1 Tax=Glutamicibacter protophormiae TaxID=37930 RepID=UPI002A81111D|nr:ISL3 family transposase [Glutamicibacter protophormiae]WPR64415.1 ISL3 family transposase [Glutamicibacter protophormiae]WPR67909.1 ISL3 family transposase [Glutamicibacter protophormiae]
MFKDTGPLDAASILLNLTDYRVITATHEPAGRQVLIEPVATEAACPSCGVLTTRIQSRPVHRVKDLPSGGDGLDLWVRKRRMACQESACPRRSFVQTTSQLPFRARITARLSQRMVDEMSCELRAVSRVAAAHGVSWPTVMARLNAVGELVRDVDRMFIRRLGIDEHRFRKVRYARGRNGKVVRIEPWSIVFTDLDTGKILDIVDGRRGATVKRWLKARPRYWRQRVQFVAIDMSSEFRKAVRETLPTAKISVDHFHVIQRANLMITQVRRRRSHEVHERRGRAADPAYKYRKLLTCNLENLSITQVERLKLILESDPELGVIYGIKEHVLQLLKTRDIHDFQSRWAMLEKSVKATKMVEAKSLFRTLTAWRSQLLVFIRTRLMNARSEAANLTTKNLKRIGRGYRNHSHYRMRIFLYTAGLRPC